MFSLIITLSSYFSELQPAQTCWLTTSAPNSHSKNVRERKYRGLKLTPYIINYKLQTTLLDFESSTPSIYSAVYTTSRLKSMCWIKVLLLSYEKQIQKTPRQNCNFLDHNRGKEDSGALVLQNTEKNISYLVKDPPLHWVCVGCVHGFLRPTGSEKMVCWYGIHGNPDIVFPQGSLISESL